MSYLFTISRVLFKNTRYNPGKQRPKRDPKRELCDRTQRQKCYLCAVTTCGSVNKHVIYASCLSLNHVA